MRGLDSPALIAILNGSEPGRALLDDLVGEEACTTEVNLFELETIALQAPARRRGERLAALERLRRRITVLPLDDASSRAAAALARSNSIGQPPSVWMMLGIFEANGCTSVVTSAAARLGGVRCRPKIVNITAFHLKEGK